MLHVHLFLAPISLDILSFTVSEWRKATFIQESLGWVPLVFDFLTS